MSHAGRPDVAQPKPEAFAAIVSPPASPSREDRIARGIAVWRVIGSPGFPPSDLEFRAEVRTRGRLRTYDPAGIARQMAAAMAAPPRNDRLKALKVGGGPEGVAPYQSRLLWLRRPAAD